MLILDIMREKIVVVFILFFVKIINSQSCDSSNSELCAENEKKHIYSKRLNVMSNKFIESIEHAKQTYTECNNTKCGCFINVIKKDLKPFKEKGIDIKLIQDSKTRGTFYQIINGTLYRQKECMFPSRCAGVEHFILKVIKTLPDMEFVVNTRDYPQSSVQFGEALPIFSFSKTQMYNDIIYPAWAFWEGGPAISLYPRGLGRWDQHRILLDKASQNVPWEEKNNKAFFRGSRTSSERDNLVLLSRKKPYLVDAQYTKNQAWKSDKDTLHNPPAAEVSLEEHCKYKYLFNYRGVAASFRHKHLFLCNSLVFHVGNEWTEFYYNAMKPWIHYIPVSNTATEDDLEFLILFAMDNDELVQNIAKEGRNFIWSNLRMKDVICYWKQLLINYAKLLKYKPNLEDDLIKVSKI